MHFADRTTLHLTKMCLMVYTSALGYYLQRPGKFEDLPAQQDGELESSAIAACKEADLGMIWQMIQDEHAV